MPRAPADPTLPLELRPPGTGFAGLRKRWPRTADRSIRRQADGVLRDLKVVSVCPRPDSSSGFLDASFLQRGTPRGPSGLKTGTPEDETHIKRYATQRGARSHESHLAPRG